MAGTASTDGAGNASSPDEVLAAQRVVDAEARAREAALPRLQLAPLGGGAPVTLVPFGVDGAPRPAAMDELARLLAPRSAREEEPQPIDPKLVALLLRISSELDGAPITIVSGHRKPGRGTRRTSFHVKGMAVDIAVAGKKPREVRAAAIRAGAPGIGLYGAFVHVDVRDEPYRWGGGGRSARRRR